MTSVMVKLSAEDWAAASAAVAAVRDRLPPGELQECLSRVDIKIRQAVSRSLWWATLWPFRKNQED